MYLASWARLLSTRSAVAPRFSLGWRNFHGPSGGNGGFTSDLTESSNRLIVCCFVSFCLEGGRGVEIAEGGGWTSEADNGVARMEGGFRQTSDHRPSTIKQHVVFHVGLPSH